MKVSIADTDLEPLWDKLGPSDLDKDVVREEREAEDQIQRPGLGISGSSYMASESSNTGINNHDYRIDSPFSPLIAMKPNDNLGSTVDSNFTTSSSFIRPEEEVDERSHPSAGNATIHADQRRCEQVGEGTQIGEFAIVGDHIDKRGLEEWRRILIGQQFLFVPGEEEERRAFTPKNNSIVMPKNLRYLEYDVTVEKDCDEERLNICLDEDLEAWRVWFG